ncbi:MAG: crossover junction endodeoxyribonuclease RuvC [Patescibacteria group bacterium]
MIFLGIDPGLATTGYAVIKKEAGGVLRALDWGVIETKKNAPGVRLQTIANDLNRLIRRSRPSAAAVESLYFAKNVKTALKVAEARGVILLTLQKNKIPISEFTPLQVKSQITSYGQATKKQMQTMVQRLLGLKSVPHPDDAADALALAICGAAKKII